VISQRLYSNSPAGVSVFDGGEYSDNKSESIISPPNL
jgi:hypothetical protein